MTMKKLRIWWNSDFGNECFRKDVKSVEEAKELLLLLMNYDIYLGDRVVANSGGLEIEEDDQWGEYYDDNGRDIMEILENEEQDKNGE